MYFVIIEWRCGVHQDRAYEHFQHRWAARLFKAMVLANSKLAGVYHRLLRHDMSEYNELVDVRVGVRPIPR